MSNLNESMQRQMMLQDTESLLNLIKRFPNLLETLKYYSDKGLGADVGPLLSSGSEKVAKKIVEVEELDKKGLRRQATFPMGVFRLGKGGITDLYTSGNGPCFIAILNEDSLCHLPMPLDAFISLAEILGQSPDVYMKDYFNNNVLKKIGHEKMESMLLLPGIDWKREESDSMNKFLHLSYPDISVKVRPPGCHSVWLGRNPIDPTKNQYIVHDSINRTVVKNF